MDLEIVKVLLEEPSMWRVPETCSAALSKTLFVGDVVCHHSSKTMLCVRERVRYRRVVVGARDVVLELALGRDRKACRAGCATWAHSRPVCRGSRVSSEEQGEEGDDEPKRPGDWPWAAPMVLSELSKLLVCLVLLLLVLELET